MKAKNTLKEFWLVSLLLLLVQSAGQVGAIAESQSGTELPKMFIPVPEAPMTLSLQKAKTAPYVVQYQPAFVDLDLLAAMKPDKKLNLNLFPGTSFVGVVERVERRAERRFTVAGYLQGVPNGYFTIVVEEDVAAATIRGPSPSRFFILRYAGNGVHLICQVDSEKFPPCGGGVTPPKYKTETSAGDIGLNEPKPTSQDGVLPLAACTAPDPVFDVLIVYSDVARQAAGGTTAILALCQLAIDETNQAYNNSLIGARARLVYCGEVTYNEVGTPNDHLDRLTDGNDGIMDAVHTLRDNYRADFVSLWVDDTTVAGIGWCISNEGYAFTVVSWSFATGHYSYAHEMGHNQGCAHDRQNPGAGCALYSYSYGWRFIGNDSNQYRTIMAYPPGFRIQYFSNPDVLFAGQPTGVPLGDPNEAHNALTVNNRRSTCEAFRLTRFDVWVDFSQWLLENGTFYFPYDTIAEGVSEIITGVNESELPNLWIKTGSTNEAMTISKPMTIRACGGSVTIGAP